MLRKIPFSVKIVMYVLSVLGILLFVGYELVNQILSMLVTKFGIIIYPYELIDSVPLNLVLISAAIIVCLSSLLVIDGIYFIKTINKYLKESLVERKLVHNFEEFYSAKNFFNSQDNIKKLLALYRSFDNMKSARVVLEVTTMKQLMNAVDQGILLVNRKGVVTHINHIAENQMGFIPGEIIGQALSRKTDNNILLDSLEKVFDINHKFLDLDLDEDDLTVSIYPLKDKFGDVIRALVIFSEHKKSKKGPKKNKGIAA